MAEGNRTEYGFRLAQILRKQGLSLRALALRARVDRAALRRIKSRRTLPSWPVACRIADALGVFLDDLVTRRVRKPASDVRPDGPPKKGGEHGEEA